MEGQKDHKALNGIIAACTYSIHLANMEEKKAEIYALQLQWLSQEAV